MSGAASLSYGQIFQRAWPIIIANAAVPLLGLVDTAIIGNTGNAQDLGAIALGALIFNFIYWSFGFLRMGTTGFTAQAAGAGRWLEVRLVLGRALVVAVALAALILLLQKVLGAIVFQLFQASAGVEDRAASYFSLRLWGAPATLGTFALLGVLIGLGKSRHLLVVQLLLNGLNAVLDVQFAGVMGMGVRGIALGTILAEYITLVFAGYVVYTVLQKHRDEAEAFWSWRQLLDGPAMARMLRANGDIMIRTLLLVFSFAWFTNRGATFGDITLAANHILLQFVSFSAFFLDGYAFVAESIVGNALGARQRLAFEVGVRRSTGLAAVTALLLAAGVYLTGDAFIGLLTDIVRVQVAAGGFLWLACLYILLSFGAFQLDGIFIGAVRSSQMRNAAIVSTTVFLLLCESLTPVLGNNGLWLAFIVYVVVRALSLLVYYPGIRATLPGT